MKKKIAVGVFTFGVASGFALATLALYGKLENLSAQIMCGLPHSVTTPALIVLCVVLLCVSTYAFIAWGKRKLKSTDFSLRSRGLK